MSIEPAATPDPAVTICKFKYHGLVFRLPFVRENLYQYRPSHLFGVFVKADPEMQKSWGGSEFVVFQARLTPKFEIEQVGSGYPSKDEAEVKEILRLIEVKNEIVPLVVLTAWDGGFWIATASVPEVWYDELVLFHYHKPQKFGEQLSCFSLRHFKRCLGKPPEMLKEEMLPTIDHEVAEKLFQRRAAELRAQEAAKRLPAPQKQATAPPLMLTQSQLLVLSRAFPETVKLMQNPPAKPKDAYEAYQRDIFKMTGKMDDLLTFNQEQLEAIIRARTNSRRRANAGIDPIEYELVVGWFFRGYCNMTPMARAIALRKRGLQPPSEDGIRKICKRLKLPHVRKPGLH